MPLFRTRFNERSRERTVMRSGGRVSTARSTALMFTATESGKLESETDTGLPSSFLRSNSRRMVMENHFVGWRRNRSWDICAPLAIYKHCHSIRSLMTFSSVLDQRVYSRLKCRRLSSVQLVSADLRRGKLENMKILPIQGLFNRRYQETRGNCFMNWCQ